MHQLLTERAAERDRLLAMITDRLQQDKRILSAGLKGSIGRGEHDSWSDLDLYMVVRDEDFEAVVGGRYDWTASLGSRVVTVEAPMNGQPGGAYFMAGFDFPTGLQLVDCYWQPYSLARTDPIFKPMFVHTKPLEGPVEAKEPYDAWHQTPEKDRVNCAGLAWAMIAIQGKYLARGTHGKALAFGALIRQLIAKSGGPELGEEPAEYPGNAEKLATLQQLIAVLALAAPDCGAPRDSVLRLLETVKAVLDES